MCVFLVGSAAANLHGMPADSIDTVNFGIKQIEFATSEYSIEISSRIVINSVVMKFVCGKCRRTRLVCVSRLETSFGPAKKPRVSSHRAHTYVSPDIFPQTGKNLKREKREKREKCERGRNVFPRLQSMSFRGKVHESIRRRMPKRINPGYG